MRIFIEIVLISLLWVFVFGHRKNDTTTNNLLSADGDLKAKIFKVNIFPQKTNQGNTTKRVKKTKKTFFKTPNEKTDCGVDFKTANKTKCWNFSKKVDIVEEPKLQTNKSYHIRSNKKSQVNLGNVNAQRDQVVQNQIDQSNAIASILGRKKVQHGNGKNSTRDTLPSLNKFSLF